MPKTKFFSKAPKMTRKFNGETYDFVGSGDKENVDLRAEGHKSTGHKVRTVKTSSGFFRLYVSRSKKKKR